MKSLKSSEYTMISFVGDLPNLFTLTGLFCALLSLYAALLDRFSLAVICLLWATFFDYCDGIIARRMKNRPEAFGRVGVELDSLVDMVSYAVCPVVFLLKLSSCSLWMLPVLFFMLSATALRLGYFNIFGLAGTATYTGLSLDHNILVFAFFFLFRGLFPPQAFLVLLSLVFTVISIMNLLPVPLPKYTGKGVWMVFFYIVGLTLIYAGRMI